ncbi:hypothetical protein [Aquibacillus albus]|uniref:Uncharacterized protein n=1 Tax=Aquibacillus albus TaxID=1168171 RepID=A0ABS2N2H0_9BACI|nr:hypothetical protein [Aquibacillus albus]MBM7572321.1 hypothetical protein [Aquibacillus albus]
MKSILDILNHQVTTVTEKDYGTLASTNYKLLPRFVSVPIKKEMILYVLNRKKPKEINDLDVLFEDNYIIIKGKMKKMGLSINFSVKLLPIEMDGRMLQFRLMHLKPMNHPWLNKIIFNRPPISLKKDIVSVDLNQIEKVKSIPIGTIKKIEIRNQMIWLGIWL